MSLHRYFVVSCTVHGVVLLAASMAMQETAKIQMQSTAELAQQHSIKLSLRAPEVPPAPPPPEPVAPPLKKAKAKVVEKVRPQPVKPPKPEPAKLPTPPKEPIAETKPQEPPPTKTAPIPTPRWIDPADYKRNTPPAYPRASRRQGEEGRVVLLVTIEASGTPERVIIHHSSGHKRLDSAALEAVKRWEFVPATQNGAAIQTQVLVPIEFQLRS